MRVRTHERYLNRTGLFNVKHDRGGMVDIEFIVQYFVLRDACRCEKLLLNLGNIGLLQVLADLGVINSEGTKEVSNAYRAYRALQHRFRLDGETRLLVDKKEIEAFSKVVIKLWERVFT